MTVTVKVEAINPSETVKNRHGKELKKQDCVVGDSTGCGRIVLWENDVDCLKEKQSYKWAGIGVRWFQGVNFLSVVDGCVISEADNIGETADIEEGGPEQGTVTRKVIEGEIDAVMYCEEYDGCVGCSAKVQCSDEFAVECTKRGIVMKRSKCSKHLTARLSVGGLDGNCHNDTFQQCHLKIIEELHADGADLKRKLLAAPALHFIVDKGDVVHSVEKLE